MNDSSDELKMEHVTFMTNISLPFGEDHGFVDFFTRTGTPENLQ